MQAGAPHSHQLPTRVCPARATVANGADVVSLSPLEVENHIGSISMHTAASNNLILTVNSSFKRLAEPEKLVSPAGLYQEIAQTLIRSLHKNQTLAALASQLASVADHAHSIHQSEVVDHVGRLLLSLPLSRQL